MRGDMISYKEWVEKYINNYLGSSDHSDHINYDHDHIELPTVIWGQKQVVKIKEYYAPEFITKEEMEI